MLILVGFYVYISFKFKVANAWVTRLMKVVKHCTQAYFCIILIFYAALRGPFWFLLLMRQKIAERFLLLLVVCYFRLLAQFFWQVL